MSVELLEELEGPFKIKTQKPDQSKTRMFLYLVALSALGPAAGDQEGWPSGAHVATQGNPCCWPPHNSKARPGPLLSQAQERKMPHSGTSSPELSRSWPQAAGRSPFNVAYTATVGSDKSQAKPNPQTDPRQPPALCLCTGVLGEGNPVPILTGWAWACKPEEQRTLGRP